ncbi:MAG TPA: putative LPS assembly protein LptD [Saprospiraceae bacterium]|nr:putative LPS assembly protein LptD [Saprospiraceae bacterium]
MLCQLGAQVDSLPALDTIPQDSLLVLDSLARSQDSLLEAIPVTYRLSTDSLDAPVEYNARDSMIYDIADEKIYLYGDAMVAYTTITLKASKIIFDWNTSIVTAEGMPDSTGRMAGFPQFSDGSQEFKAEQMRYNFKTRKGIVYEVTTQQNDVIVHGTRSKFISIEPQDTIEERRDIIYSQDAIFTTCTHPEPHFGIRSQKQKVIPNKLVIIGPSNLEIMGVPTPVWLPFGFFPISSGRQTGLLFPRDYQYSPQWGFGLEGVGWFFPLGDHFNLSLTSNLYVKGTWGVNASSQYRKRYKYSGSFDLGYDVRRTEADDGTIDRPKSYRFTWSHRQDPAAHPVNNFSGSINIQTNNYQSRVFNDAERVLQNQLNSNIAFNRNWKDKPISLSVGLTHNQNSSTRQVTVNFPNINFQTQTLYPLKRKNPVGKEKWYETITFRYQGEARNRFQASDTTLFSQKTLDEAEFGIRHRMNSGTSFKLWYFNLNPGVDYQEVWYLKSYQQEFTPGLEIDSVFNNGIYELDTVSYGTVSDTLLPGFVSYRQFNASLSLNTQLFGMLRLGKTQVRHVIKPSISMNFVPDYTDPSLGYFQNIQDASDPNELNQYSIFTGSIYGGPPQSGQQWALNYSLNNIFEAKVFSKKLEDYKKVKLFDNIIVSGNYNFAADSLKWSPVSMTGTTRFLKGITTLSLRATFDPYDIEMVGNSLRRVDRFYRDTKGKFLRFDNATASFNTGITVGKLRALLFGEEEKVVESEEEARSQNQEIEETDFLSLFENFRVNHNMSLRLIGQADGSDTLIVATHAINCSGSIELTDNWNINVGNFGYDFVRKGITYPSVGFSRDLHCWEMGLNWQPTRGTYSFFIRVKPGTLDFISIPYQRSNGDPINAFQ